MNERNYPQQASSIEGRNLYLTLRENIDQLILQAKARVKKLEETKDRLSDFRLLDVRIDDIQRAMHW
jgi:hypothetical protein